MGNFVDGHHSSFPNAIILLSKSVNHSIFSSSRAWIFKRCFYSIKKLLVYREFLQFITQHRVALHAGTSRISTIAWKMLVFSKVIWHIAQNAERIWDSVRRDITDERKICSNRLIRDLKSKRWDGWNLNSSQKHFLRVRKRCFTEILCYAVEMYWAPVLRTLVLK